jgi:hypothetical protein
MFRAIANNSLGSATSQVATLTIIADQVNPTLAKFSLCDSFSELLLIFSEAVTPATAGNTANYTFSGGGIDSATLQADERRVILRTTTPMAEGAAYTLAIQGIQDISTAANTLDTTNIAFTSSIVQTGYVRREIYTNVVTTSVADVLNNAKLLARSPDLLAVANSVETPSAFGDNYAQRISGYLLPQQSGNYLLYLATDDHSHLYVSTDADPANKALIAQETTWADMRLWTGDRTSGTRGFPPSNISTNPVSLMAGSRYYFEIVHREGTGGDHLGLTWRLDTDPEPANGSPSALTGPLIAAVVSAADVTITQEPQSVTTNENRRVTLITAATASAAGLVISYQWQRDDGVGGFTNIPGAMASSYTTPLLVSENDNNSQYRAVVAVAGDEAISQVATLTVNDDIEAPQVLSLVRLGGSKTQIRVEYDEPVDSTALDALNFIVENEFTGDVIPLLENQSVRIDERTVILIASQPLSDSARYKLQFFGTSDLSGNTLTGEKRIAFLGPIVPSGAQNLAVFEAENYDGILSQGGSSWEFHTATAGFSGSGAMDSTPNTGRGVNEPAHLTTAPRLDYRISFPVAGTYFVWVRGYGRNGNDDSGHVGLNNVSGVNYNWRLTGWGTTYSWQRTVTASPARVDVPSAGLHTFNFWMREDGTIADKFILTTDSAFTPTGTGPAESSRGTLPPVRQPISIARTGNSVTISWPVSANLEEADDVTGSWTVVATAATSHTVEASAAMKFYRVVEP